MTAPFSEELLMFCKQNPEKGVSYPLLLTGYTMEISCSTILHYYMQGQEIPRMHRKELEGMQKEYCEKLRKMDIAEKHAISKGETNA